MIAAVSAYQDWRQYSTARTQKGSCVVCQRSSTTDPRGWAFRYVALPGNGKQGRKVTTHRICPACAKEALHACP